MPTHADDEELSLAWRCQGCGRIHLALERQPAPETCLDCTGTAFRSVAPSENAREVYREAAGALGRAFGEAPEVRPDATDDS